MQLIIVSLRVIVCPFGMSDLTHLVSYAMTRWKREIICFLLVISRVRSGHNNEGIIKGIIHKGLDINNQPPIGWTA